MSLRIIYLDSDTNRKEYTKIISTMGGKYPHYSIEYLNTFCMDINKASFFLYQNQKSGAVIVMPGYIRTISLNERETPYYDFVSPYGYSGPVMNQHTAEDEIKLFWQELDAFYQDKNIITEFIRFSLNDNYIGYTGELIPTLLNIKGKIIGAEEQWKNFEHKVRKNVKKAQSAQLHTKVYFLDIPDEILSAFYEIYMHTMQRNNATEQFYYTLQQFKDYFDRNPEHALIALVYEKNTPVAAELVLLAHDTMYSFLGGTLSDYFEKRPNDLLKYDLINWGRDNGMCYFTLGGGYGQDDGIYRYKKSFFPDDSVTYFTGRKILNEVVYDELVVECNEIRKKNGLQELSLYDKSFFPLYRKQN